MSGTGDEGRETREEGLAGESSGGGSALREHGPAVGWLELRRREFLKAAALGSGAALAGLFARGPAGLREALAAGAEVAGAPRARGRALRHGGGFGPPGFRGGKRSTFLTPNRDFYLVAVDPDFRPEVGLSDWRLELAAPGAPARRLTFEELTALPAREVLRTFECIGNEVGGDLIGNAKWQAVPLRDVLEPVLPERGIADLRLLMIGLDDYYTTVPLSLALQDEAWIAHRMNGEPLPEAHGWPARTMLPDRYGMKQPRWLKRLEITAEKKSGFWEERGWSWDASLKAMSRIDTPADGEKIGRATRLEITGIAYAGDRPVGRVEVTTDKGKTWNRATLATQPRRHVWSLWTYEWTPTQPGDHVLGVRAFDADGRKQPTEYHDPKPDGASGIHAVKVKVQK